MIISFKKKKQNKIKIKLNNKCIKKKNKKSQNIP